MAMAWKKKVVIKWIVLFTAELLATAFLLFLGCGLLVVDTIPSKSVPLVQVGLGWGFAVLTSVQIFGHISGAHLNPAVTVAAATLGIFPLLQVPLYIGGQVIGGILGYLMLAAITPKDFLYKHEFSDFQNKTVGICQTRINKDISLVQGFFAEFFAVLIIAMFCGAVWDKKNSQQIGSAAIKFSSLITILVFVLANYTGASFNPARSFGPAVVSGGWEDHWVYWIAPMSGGFVGALIYRLIFLKFMPMNDLIIKTPVKDEVGEVP